MNNFYLSCLHAIVRALQSRYPNIEGKEGESPQEHLLWMAEKMWYWRRTSWKQQRFLVRFANFFLRRFDLQIYDVAVVRETAKAGRWLGWMLREAEDLGLWSNQVSRNNVRSDVVAGRDIPL